jgi:hypothetical protein
MSDVFAMIAGYALAAVLILINAAFFAGFVLLGFWVLDIVGIL